MNNYELQLLVSIFIPQFVKGRQRIREWAVPFQIAADFIIIPGMLRKVMIVKGPVSQAAFIIRLIFSSEC